MLMRPDVRRILCPAKINLGLRVIGLRPDGYHEIRTVLHSVRLADQLEVRKSDRFTLEIQSGEDLPGMEQLRTDGSNLVLRAAAEVARRRRVRGASFRLLKRIPPQSGLGGASSDAAGALLALDSLYQLNLTARELHEIAASLGSDVPFFLLWGTALALGRGEEIYPLPEPPPMHFAVALPEAGNATPEVYRAWDHLLTSRDKTCRVNDFAPWCFVLRGEHPSLLNDLEEAVLRLRPELRRLRAALEEAGAPGVAMTGSGSAFYACSSSPGDAESAARAASRAGYRAITTTSLGREDRDRALWINSWT